MRAMEPQVQYAKTSDGVDIAFATLGTGEPFMHLNPMPWSHIEREWQLPEFRSWYGRIAEKYQLVRLDWRGCGSSDRNPENLSLDSYVLDLECVVDRLRLERVVLFGNAYGATAATAFAARHPDIVSNLVLVSPISSGADAYKTPEGEAFRALREGDWKIYTEAVVQMAWGWSTGQQAETLAGLLRDCVSQEVSLATHRVIEAWDITSVLEQVTTPTLVIHPREKDLVIGTHGQSIWVLDDTRPLAEWNAAVASADAHLFNTSRATIFNYRKDTSYRGQAEFAGQNPVSGALITYALGPGGGEATLRVTTADGRVVRELAVPSDPGMHRVNWDLRHRTSDATERWSPHDGSTLARPIGSQGPWVSPGKYTLTLEARGTVSTRTLDVRGDPMLPLSQTDYEARENFLLELMEVPGKIQAARPELRCPGGRGGGFGGGPQRPQGVDGELCQIRRTAQQLIQGLSGGGVRPGTLYPPTQDHRARKASLEARLARILASQQDD